MSTRFLITCALLTFAGLACESASSTKPIITPVLDALRIETSTTNAVVGDTLVVKAVGTLHLPETPDNAFERDIADGLRALPNSSTRTILHLARVVTQLNQEVDKRKHGQTKLKCQAKAAKLKEAQPASA